VNILLIITGILMAVSGIAVLYEKSLKKAAIIMGVLSLIATFLFVFMKAYDVAITEASIGAALTLTVYFFAIKRLEEEGYKDKE